MKLLLILEEPNSQQSRLAALTRANRQLGRTEHWSTHSASDIFRAGVLSRKLLDDGEKLGTVSVKRLECVLRK